MNSEELELRVKELELQLRILKSEIQKLKGQKPALTSADLYGIFAHRGTVSEEEIEGGLYRRLKPDFII